MSARFDHLVVAVADLDEAAARWRSAGLHATRGGAHPVGTENALVRGPKSAYVELIAAGSEESNPWLDRVRSAGGPISWAIAVDDVDASRAALVEVGVDPRPVTEGSRTTPEGAVVGWRMCDVGPGPYDDSLPFLIQWTTPMPPGPDDGPVVQSMTVTAPDPECVADLLLALGFVASEHWPRRAFHDPSGNGVGIQLLPLGEPDVSEGAWVMSWEASDEPAFSLSMSLPQSEFRSTDIDGVRIGLMHDRRRFPATALLPAVDEAFARLRGDLSDWPNPHLGGRSPLEEEYSRVLEPGKYRLLAVRADAWIEVVVAAGLGAAQERDPDTVTWASDVALKPSRVTVLTGRPGTQPVVVGIAASQAAEDCFVQIGVGEPVEVLERQPDCGCDACDTGSVDLLEALDSALVLALSGGVYVVREGTKVVTRSVEGWGSSGMFADGESERWLAEAADGRRTDGVMRGDAWL